MQNYYNDLSIFEAVKPEDNKTVLKIFDFDGTIFNSPTPNRDLWDKKTLGKLMGDFSMSGYGWFQNTLTLDDKYIEGIDFNDSVVDEVNKSMKDPNNVTVLLTGRNKTFLGQIKKIVYEKGLEFDEYGLKPHNDFNPETTFGFKTWYVKDLVEKYNPAKIEVWDDRAKHIKKFNELLDTFNIPYEVHHVDVPDINIKNTDLEKELVEKLIADPRANRKKPAKRFNQQQQKKEKKERKPIFWAVYLHPESHGILTSSLEQEIPEGWKLFAHHMTIAFGNIKGDDVKEFIDNNLGQEAELTAVAVGMSDEAMAVRIESNVPSDNKIPHITVAVPEGGKPVKSNFITNWKKLDTPIKLKGKIGAQY